MARRVSRYRLAGAFIALMLALVAIYAFSTGYRFGNDLAHHENRN